MQNSVPPLDRPCPQGCLRATLPAGPPSKGQPADPLTDPFPSGPFPSGPFPSGPVPSDPLSSGAPSGPLSVRAILSCPLPHLVPADRLLLRGAVLAGRRKIHSIKGLEHIAPGRDPFILVLNHSTRLEALVVPPTLFLLRQGRRIHFMADWNFAMIPGVGLLYRSAGVITVARKPARPRFLNVLKPLFTDAASPMAQARRHLAAGRSIGVFPEGSVNRDPLRLGPGRSGAARLSLESGIPVVPAGLRFPGVPHGSAVAEGSPVAIEIGAPLLPPAARASHAATCDWHRQIMTAIAGLSGKSFEAAQEAER